MSSPTRSGELPGWRHAILNARYPRVATKELSLASSWHRTTEGSRPRGSSDIPALTVILDVVVASGEWQRLGRRRLTRFPHVARGLTCQRCVAAADPRP